MIVRFKHHLRLNNLDLFLMTLGAIIMAFTLVNIHIPSKITEGGVIGIAILAKSVFGINPAIVSFVIDALLYGLGFLLLKKGFLGRSLLASFTMATFYALFLEIGPILPSFENQPALAAIFGGIGIGLGCGLVITRGSAAGGDDSYALIMKKYTRLSIAQAYFLSDFIVLLVSVFIYLPWPNFFWSILSTFISSNLISVVETRFPKPAHLQQADPSPSAVN